ncbi:hypothetical protein BC940DRAFT_344326 [Gongronella butleri]|nr:hypothetical protein BC940DRAFT_344326 [Gongronella butleri]
MQGVGASTRLWNNSQTVSHPIVVNGGLRLDNLTLFGNRQISDYVGIIPNTSDWSDISIFGVCSPRADFLRTFREVSVRTANDRIFYLGGLGWNLTYHEPSYNGVDDPTLAVSMDNPFFEDLVTNYFNISYINGMQQRKAPSVRYWHTATEIPGHKVIVYGGAFKGRAVEDYAFILDANKLVWSEIQFPQVVDGACNNPGVKCGGPRYGHSAILVNNELLYIMFGANSANNLMGDTLILNTTSMMWLDSGETTSVNNVQENSSSSSPASGGLSGGAIGGIVVGVVVGVGAIIGAAVFFALKKRKQRDAVPAPPAFYDQDLTSGKMPFQKPQWNPSHAMDDQDVTSNSGTSSPNHTLVKPFSAK